MGYAVALINNERIGVIGVTDPYLEKLVNIGKLTVQPTDPADLEKLAKIIQEGIDKLKSEGINKIVLLARISGHDINRDPLIIVSVDGDCIHLGRLVVTFGSDSHI